MARSLFLVGLDPATGRELWRQAASPGEVAAGIGVGPIAVGDRVAYLRPDPKGNLYARLVVANVRTGADVAATAPLLFGSPPIACAGSTDVCTLSRAGYDDGYRYHRLRVATGAYVPEPTGLPDRARAIGADGLVDFGRRAPETIGLVRDGALRWQLPLRRAFPDGFSTDNGWSWRRFRAEQVYVGSVYAQASGKPGNPRSRNLATGTASAGLSEQDGTVLWRDTGSDTNCGLNILANPRDPDGPVLPVRCRAKGTGTWRPDGKTSFVGLDVTVEGYDVRTGKTTWSVPVGAAEALAGADDLPAIAGATEVVLRAGTGPLVLNVADGAHHTPQSDAVFWCRTEHRFTYREPYYHSGKPYYERSGGRRASTCDATGKPAAGTPNGPATAALGAPIGQYAVIATANGFTGYKIE